MKNGKLIIIAVVLIALGVTGWVLSAQQKGDSTQDAPTTTEIEDTKKDSIDGSLQNSVEDLTQDTRKDPVNSGLQNYIGNTLQNSSNTSNQLTREDYAVGGLQYYTATGQSMEPNFHDGDTGVFDTSDSAVNNLQRSDIVLHLYPKNTSFYFIKRIVGLPGEKVEVRDGRVYIDGAVLNEPYLGSNVVTSGNTTVQLGADEYFVLGDNRANSSDSRSWGSLKRELILGKFLRMAVVQGDN